MVADHLGKIGFSQKINFAQTTCLDFWGEVLSDIPNKSIVEPSKSLTLSGLPMLAPTQCLIYHLNKYEQLKLNGIDIYIYVRWTFGVYSAPHRFQ